MRTGRFVAGNSRHSPRGVVDSVTNAPSVIAYDSESLHPFTPRVLEADDFTSYADYAAFTATLPARFPGFRQFNSSSFTTVDDRTCLTSPEGPAFSCWKTLPVALPRIWWRGQIFLADTVHANNNVLLFDETVSTDFNTDVGAVYRIFDEAWQDVTGLSGNLTAQSLASLKGRWVDLVTLAEEDACYLWVDGSLNQTVPFDGSGGWKTIVVYLHLQLLSGSPDPTNNIVYARLFEFMDGSGDYNPYSGLEPWE